MLCSNLDIFRNHHLINIPSLVRGNGDHVGKESYWRKEEDGFENILVEVAEVGLIGKYLGDGQRHVPSEQSQGVDAGHGFADEEESSLRHHVSSDKLVFSHLIEP